MAKIDREEILERAIPLFLEGGYDDTSMAQIAEACGLRKASLYHHFPDKETLVLAVIECRHAQFREAIFSIAWEGKGDAAQRLRRMSDATFKFFKGRKGGCLLGNFALALAEREPAFQAPLQSYFDEWVGAIAHLLEGAHGPVQSRELALDAVAQIQGAIMMMRLYQDPKSLRRAVDAVSALLS